jgi:hypothetical protein
MEHLHQATGPSNLNLLDHSIAAETEVQPRIAVGQVTVSPMNLIGLGHIRSGHNDASANGSFVALYAYQAKKYAVVPIMRFVKK